MLILKQSHPVEVQRLLKKRSKINVPYIDVILILRIVLIDFYSHRKIITLILITAFFC